MARRVVPTQHMLSTRGAVPQTSPWLLSQVGHDETGRAALRRPPITKETGLAERAFELVGQGLEQVAEHGARAGLDESFGGHAGAQLEIAQLGEFAG